MNIYSKENDFLESVTLISEDILKRYNDKIDKIALIGFSKLSYPLLVEISKRTNIKINNISCFIDNKIDEFIIIEDMISFRKRANLLTNEFKNRGKKILAVYSLFMSEEIKNEYKLFNSDIFLLDKRFS